MKRFALPPLTAALSAVLLCCALGTAPAAADAGGAPRAAAAPKAPPVALASGERLAHPVVKGPLGPWPAVEVWLTQSSQVDDGPFTAHVAVPVAGARPTVHTLPPPDETESAFLMTVRSVMFRAVGSGPERSLVVLYSAVRIGPGQDPAFGACVYTWDGAAFVRDTAVEEQLAGARNSADVARRLAARKAR